MGRITTIATIRRSNGRKGQKDVSLGVSIPRAKTVGLKAGDLVAVVIIPIDDLMLESIIPEVMDFSTFPMSRTARNIILSKLS